MATANTLDPSNGLDLAALGEFAEAITLDPSKALAEFRVTTRWTGQTRSETRVESYRLAGKRIARDFTILADEPVELLGEDTAPNPQELLMAAINSCMLVGYVSGAAMRGIALTSLEIEMHGELDLRGFLGLGPDVPPGYRWIDYDVRIAGDGTREQFEEIHNSVMCSSPNFFNMSTPIELRGKLVVE